jgi:hypothetical protein
MTYLLDVHHHKAINLRILLLVKATVGQRHFGGLAQRLWNLLLVDERCASLLEYAVGGLKGFV